MSAEYVAGSSGLKPKTAMSSRLEVMRSVKPSFEKFYATLSEKQQMAVDGLFTRGHGGHRGHRG